RRTGQQSATAHRHRARRNGRAGRHDRRPGRDGRPGQGPAARQAAPHAAGSAARRAAPSQRSPHRLRSCTMNALADFYAVQPFWIWLAIGVLLLAIETMFSTEWLLWPAVSAGIVAVLTAVGVRLGLPGEVAIFAVLAVIATLLSRRLIQKANPGGVDINDRDSRLIGQRARVV